jgi:opacity protein-like surface antigen
MKKNIITLLALVTIFSSTIFAESYNLSSSLLYVYVDADSSIEANTNIDADLDDAPGLSIEWSSEPIDGISFGLEYIYFGTEADISGIINNDDASLLNSLTGGTFQAGNSKIKEEYKAHTAMVNIAYNIALSDQSIAYIGAGVGFCHFNQELSISNPGEKGSIDDSDITYAYQLKAGVRYALNDAWAVNGGLRYIGFGDPEFSYGDVDLSGDVSALAIELGLSYTF